MYYIVQILCCVKSLKCYNSNDMVPRACMIGLSDHHSCMYPVKLLFIDSRGLEGVTKLIKAVTFQNRMLKVNHVQIT